MTVIYVRAMRPKKWVVAAAAALLGLTACSSAGEDADSIVVSTTEQIPSSTVTVPATTEPVELELVDPLRVEMSVDVVSAGIDAELIAIADPSQVEQLDPFGAFASCSGWRTTFSTYSVLIAQPDQEVSALSVITTSLVTGPRIYDADVRVEFAAGAAVTATGTITIGPDLRSGEFLAFEPGGERVEGSFVCTGGEPGPEVLSASDGAGTLEAVEVVALLSSRGSARVVELAVDTSRSPDVAVECPAAVDGTAPVLVRVDGDQSVGAITTFELTDGEAPTMRLRVGGVSYEFGDVSVTATDPAVAGTFSASANGIAVDGAFRCT